jgi:hypothetical protein
MMKVLKFLGIAILVLLAFLGIGGFFIADPGNVSYTQTLNAEVHTLYAVASDVSTWKNWDYWSMKDPNMEETLSPNTKGNGAWRSWSSENPSIGKGRMELSNCIHGKQIQNNLRFEDMDNPATGLIEFKAIDSKHTEVKWSFTYSFGSNPYMRWIGVFMQSMLLDSFKESLNNLEKVAQIMPQGNMAIAEEDYEMSYAEESEQE